MTTVIITMKDATIRGELNGTHFDLYGEEGATATVSINGHDPVDVVLPWTPNRSALVADLSDHPAESLAGMWIEPAPKRDGIRPWTRS